MQLIIFLIIGLVFSISEKIFSAYKVSSAFMFYTDQTDVNIAEEMIMYQVDLSTKTQLKLNLGLDSVSSASFDAVSSPSKSSKNTSTHEDDESGEDEEDGESGEGGEGKTTKFRTSVNGTLTHAWTHDFKTVSSFAGSIKSDYQSVTIGQSIIKSLGSKTTLSAGGYFTANNNNPEIATDNTYMLPPDGKNLNSQKISGLLSLEYILSRNTKLTFISEYFNSTGYQSTGYQRVDITNSLLTTQALEVLPDGREGGAGTLIYSHLINNSMAFHWRNRYYTDSYKINAWASDISLPFYYSDILRITPRYRYYRQTAAEFWIPDAAEVPTGLFTNHYALGDITAHQVGLSLNKEFETILFNKYTFGNFYASYDYYTAQSGFYFHTVSVGIDLNF